MREAVFAERALVRIGDLAGRTRGTGFVADPTGTVITSHEAVDGLSRLVVHACERDELLVESGAITELPEWNLALIRTDGLAIAPLLVGADRAGARTGTANGTQVRICTPQDDGDGHGNRTDCGTVAALAGTPLTVTYTSTTSSRQLDGALELRLPEESAGLFRVGGPASGAPVLDAATGAVIAVVGTALHVPDGARRRFAVPLRTAGLWDCEGQLAATLARNGASVPGFGRDLNFAGALRLAHATARPALERAEALARCHVERPQAVGALREFARSGASVTALVGRPGTGRTTALARLAAERSRGDGAAPTVWLRGAQMRDGDGSVREAVDRALGSVRPRGEGDASRGSSLLAPGDEGPGRADVAARLARDARRPLLVLVDAPEEMPPGLSGRLRRWAAGTAGWLRASGARMILACGPELWALLGELFPPELLYGGHTGDGGVDGGYGELPPCVRLKDLRAAEAAHARGLYGLGAEDLAAPDAGHPLTMRMLAEVRAEQTSSGGESSHADHMGYGDAELRGGGRESEDPGARLPEYEGAFAAAASGRNGTGPGSATGPRTAPGADTCGERAAAVGPIGRPASHARQLTRDDVFSAYLDLTALRIARKLVGDAEPARVRRLAVRTAGRLHEVARRGIGPARGALSREEFEEVFPSADGSAAAVLAEGVVEAAGDRFRFADGEFGEWMQGRHLDVDAALEAFVHGGGVGGEEAAGGGRARRQRIGPVVHALVLCESLEGAEALERRLRGLVDVVVASAETGCTGRGSEARWWAGRLLRETLLRVPDARPHYGLLRGLAEGLGAQPDAGEGEFGAPFWRRLALPTAQRIGLLRLLLPSDAPLDGAGGPQRERFLDAVGEMLAAEPEVVMPLLCGWFTDRRPLAGRAAPVPEGRSGTGAGTTRERPGTGTGSGPGAGTGSGSRGGPDTGGGDSGESGGGTGGETVTGAPDSDHSRAHGGHREGGTPRPTVASAAQALLYTYRRLAGDLVLDLLTDACHPRADELLGELASEEPSSFCRAVDRWANHPAALRQIAAAEYGPRMARKARSRRDRDHLERAAHTLLRLPGSALHGPNAMAMLLRLRQGTRASPAEPERDRDLVAALGMLAATGSGELSAAVADEIGERPAPGLAAVRSRLRERPGGGERHLTAALARVRRADLAVPTAQVVCEYGEMWPESAADALAEFVRGRAAYRPRECCPGLRMLTDALLCTPYPELRAGLVRGLGDAGGPVAEQLLSVLLVGERDPVVLDAAKGGRTAPGGTGAPDGPGGADGRGGIGSTGSTGTALTASAPSSATSSFPGSSSSSSSSSGAGPSAPWSTAGPPFSPLPGSSEGALAGAPPAATPGTAARVHGEEARDVAAAGGRARVPVGP